MIWEKQEKRLELQATTEKVDLNINTGKIKMMINLVRNHNVSLLNNKK